jgi:HAD superfamily hydrolase (TIGR01490 family)
MQLVVFDIDGTLIPGSSEWGFVRYLHESGELGWHQYRTWLAQMGPFLLRYRRNAIRKNKGYLAGHDVAHIHALGGRYVRERLAPQVRVELQRRLERHRLAGDRIMLLSGAPGFLVAPLAACLHSHGSQGAELSHQAGRYDGGTPTLHPIGEEKTRIVQRWAAELDLGLERVTAYGDSGSDLPLLRAVGTAVAVAPKPPLRRVALARGWELLADA